MSGVVQFCYINLAQRHVTGLAGHASCCGDMWQIKGWKDCLGSLGEYLFASHVSDTLAAGVQELLTAVMCWPGLLPLQTSSPEHDNTPHQPASCAYGLRGSSGET